MRVVAGSLRGRRLVAPEGRTTRPTTDMVREAVFNALGSMEVLLGARVVDLFAGSGALGIEALSRGADHCVFVESDRNALGALRENLRTLGLESRATVVASDAGSYRCGDADVVLADPPYGFDGWAGLLEGVGEALVVAEGANEVSAPPGWEVRRSRRYGRTWVTFLQRVP
jgi:16S rRNA (guanine966-N2)-methyltransferase